MMGGFVVTHCLLCDEPAVESKLAGAYCEAHVGAFDSSVGLTIDTLMDDQVAVRTSWYISLAVSSVMSVMGWTWEEANGAIMQLFDMQEEYRRRGLPTPIKAGHVGVTR